MLCWHWWELSTAATIVWAGSMPPLANRSPSGQSSKLPHPAGSLRKQGHGWVPKRGLKRETGFGRVEGSGWGKAKGIGKNTEYKLVFCLPYSPFSISYHSLPLPQTPMPATAEPSPSWFLQRSGSIEEAHLVSLTFRDSQTLFSDQSAGPSS